jgi:hypothetical protein
MEDAKLNFGHAWERDFLAYFTFTFFGHCTNVRESTLYILKKRNYFKISIMQY